MTTGAFVELEEDNQKTATESIDNEARYEIVVKFTNSGFKLTNLELAGKDNDEGDAVSPPATKAKKTAAGKTWGHLCAGSIATHGARF